MKAAVLNVGNEILIGHTINTNLSIIAKNLADYGIIIEEQRTIKDDKEIIVKSFNELLENYEMIIVSGGLGPTADDITTESISYAINRDTMFNEEVFDKLEKYFSSKGRFMTDNNRKQAVFPRGCQILENEIGTACGYFLREGRKWVIVLPGPPVELEHVLDKFLNHYNVEDIFNIKTINTYGIGESQLEDRLRHLEIDEEFSVNTYSNKMGVDIKIITEDGNMEKMDDVVNLISEEFSEYIYDTDSISLSKSLLDKLLENNKKIVFAESCTGGHLASFMTDNPGSSKAFLCSLVTYSNEAKMKELDIKKETLEKYTAVSEQTANEMLDGLIKKYDVDYYAISTGFASPTEDDKTNGLVYIGIYDKENDERKIIKQRYYGSRAQIISRVSNNIFFNIIKLMD